MNRLFIRNETNNRLTFRQMNRQDYGTETDTLKRMNRLDHSGDTDEQVRKKSA